MLGGGLVPGSLVLLGGEPGVGKSTLLLTALAAISRDRRALLVTGEESVAQVKLRAERLGGAEAVEILAETELETVCQTLQAERPDVCVIDSVQTLYASELGSAPGSVAQVREAAARLLRVAKESGVATILVGHVTKDGSVAGPRVLEHLVDCVLQFEGDRYHAHRVLRAVKNRFGSTNELGVFEMTGAGLVGVPDPSEVFGRTVARRARSRRRVRARGHAADPARDPGARGAERARDAAPRRDRHRPEAARDDRRRALAPRTGLARPGGRLRQRRRRRPHRRAGRRPRRRARHRLRRPARAGEDGRRGVRRDRPHGAAAPGGAGRAAPRGVREARPLGRRRPGRARLRLAKSRSRPQRRCGRRSRRGWMATDPKETTERKAEHRLGDLGFTRTPSEEDPRRRTRSSSTRSRRSRRAPGSARPSTT